MDCGDEHASVKVILGVKKKTALVSDVADACVFGVRGHMGNVCTFLSMWL